MMGNEGDKDFGLVISADTVVVRDDGTILEKPSDANEAFQMLKSLIGKPHKVVSGTHSYKEYTSNTLK